MHKISNLLNKNVEFANFLNNGEVKEFYSKFNLINANKNNAVLISKNYTKDNIISTKLYCEIKDNNINIFKMFFNDISLISKLLPHWNSNRESSLCAGIKYDNKIQKFIPYFHIKFNYNSAIDIDIYKPTKYILPTSSLRGISIEFYNIPILKKYFYYESELEKKFLSNKFNLKEIPNHFEYTESNNVNKIIFVYDRKNNIFTTRDIIKKANKNIILDVKSTFKSFKVLPCFYGEYISDNITAVYWSLSNKPLCIEI